MNSSFSNYILPSGQDVFDLIVQKYVQCVQWGKIFVTFFLAANVGFGSGAIQSRCPGYRASNIQHLNNGLIADLELAGPACNLFGTDLPELKLTVEYQTNERLHVIIEDRDQIVYQVPENVLPRPGVSNLVSTTTSQLRFDYVADPFSFTVSRSDGQILFDTSTRPIIFESQYLNVRTALPQDPNLYGLGEHSDPFRLNTTNYTRTFWARDAGIPAGQNIYGSHPIYIEHRGKDGSHGVVFVNSNGMDVKIDTTGGQFLEYNVLGGVLDFYFVAGPSPIEVAKQIAGVIGNPAMVPYSGFGYHNCRYGYEDVYQVAEAVHNYSAASIPLETMWSDIDYMDLRQIFTLDSQRYPIAKMRELVDYLHAHQQHYVVMVDPAVGIKSQAYKTGHDRGIFMKRDNGSDYKGVVWPGVAAFPDWFHPDTQDYWTNEFGAFFSKDSGIDIDFLWIDMNEASNFCIYPCADPEGFAREHHDPPMPPPVRNGSAIPLPEFPPDFQPHVRSVVSVPVPGSKLGLPGRQLIEPPYKIHNGAGSLPSKTLDTSLAHHGGFVEYDTHNLYGTMMSNASRHAMLSRRPGQRPLVITRSTFLGAGTYVAHWLGDNESSWAHYRISIAQMLQFASIFQLPMVGSDVCGFGGNTTELLCARWMMLGAFYPFYRNHNDMHKIPQEAYRWASVAASARYAIDIRYRLLDYIYTAFWQQTQDGTPLVSPLFYHYPTDANTYDIEHQFFYGSALLVSPVVDENSTSVSFYLPDDVFYDWNNGLSPVRGRGCTVTVENVDFQTIPLHVRGGTIIPARARSANTTAELRKQPFHLIVAPGLDGSASGTLYLDEGSMINQPATSIIKMIYADGFLSMAGIYQYAADVSIESVSILGITRPPTQIIVGGLGISTFKYNSTTQAVAIACHIPLTASSSLQLLRIDNEL